MDMSYSHDFFTDANRQVRSYFLVDNFSSRPLGIVVVAIFIVFANTSCTIGKYKYIDGNDSNFQSKKHIFDFSKHVKTCPIKPFDVQENSRMFLYVTKLFTKFGIWMTHFFLVECYFEQQKKLFQSDTSVTKMGVSK